MKRLALGLAVTLVGCATAPEPMRPVVEELAALRPAPAPASAPEPSAEPAPLPQAVVEPLAPRAAEAEAAKPATPVPASAPARPSRAELVALNDERLLDVYPGMGRRRVEQLMTVQYDGKPWNPFKRETLRGRDGKAYSVVFYLTREPAPGKAITEAQLTPVIFENDKVYAIGRHPLKKLRRAACETGSGCS